MHYTATRDELRARTDEVFGWVASGQLRVSIGGRYPAWLTRPGRTRIRSCRTTGKLLRFRGRGAAAFAGAAPISGTTGDETQIAATLSRERRLQQPVERRPVPGGPGLAAPAC